MRLIDRAKRTLAAAIPPSLAPIAGWAQSGGSGARLVQDLKSGITTGTADLTDIIVTAGLIGLVVSGACFGARQRQLGFGFLGGTILMLVIAGVAPSFVDWIYALFPNARR